LVIRTAGTNCDEESAVALRMAGADVTVEHINQLKKHADLSQYRILAVPGGFSYGDDIAAGKVFSLEIKLNFKEAIAAFIKNGGLVIGICNGFQVLAKTGLLPDADFTQRVTLMHNDCGKYQDRHVYLQLNKQGKGAKIWFNGLPDVIAMPMAHGEGKFFCDDATLARVEKDQLVAFRYCDKGGNPATEFPANPNGSLNSIAGIFDTTGQVMGLMPHPERIMFKEQSLFWQEGTEPALGLEIFKSAVRYCEGKK
jgi:phosphoribosylformylglycinamidine synthase